MTSRAGAGLTATGFRHLVDDAGADLNRAGAAATFAWTVGGRRSPGATWINVTSKRGHGRLIRHRDGSFDSTAHDGEGGQLHDAHGAEVTADEFRRLIASLSPGPAPTAASRQPTFPSEEPTDSQVNHGQQIDEPARQR